MKGAAGVEDKLVDGKTPVGHRGGEPVGGAADVDIAKDSGTMEEGAVVGVGRVELVDAVEERWFGVREDLLQVDQLVCRPSFRPV